MIEIDPRLEKALSFSNYRQSLRQSKLELMEEKKQNTRHSQNGGIFQITPEFLTFVHMIKMQNVKSFVFEDINQNPIRILDVSEFFDTVQNQYIEAMNSYYAKFTELTKKRNTATVSDWK